MQHHAEYGECSPGRNSLLAEGAPHREIYIPRLLSFFCTLWDHILPSEGQPVGSIRYKIAEGVRISMLLHLDRLVAQVSCQCLDNPVLSIVGCTVELHKKK